MTSAPQNRLGIELLTIFGMNPVDQVRLAAELGCAHISLGLSQMPFNPHRVPAWNLRDDAALQREMVAILADTGASDSLGEGFAVRPGQAMRDKAGDMDLMARLGARGLGAVSMEADDARAREEFVILAEMAAARGMLATTEFTPSQKIATLTQALDLVRYVNQPHFRILFDAMHFSRSGGKVAEIMALDPALIGYAQLCDVPLIPVEPEYLDEAMFMRSAPGKGDLPLADFLAALPADIPIGLELPNLALAEAGVAPVDAIRPAVEMVKQLLGG